MDVIRPLVAQIPRFLRPGGTLLFEIGAEQADAAASLVGEEEKLELLDTVRDYAGHSRVIVARRREMNEKDVDLS